MSRPLLCSEHFLQCEFMDFMEYTTGVASNVLPERILDSIAVTSVHKVTNHLAEPGTVTNTITTTAARVRQGHRHRWSSCCRDQEREKERNNNKHRQRGISWRFVLGFLISFSVRFYQVKLWRQCSFCPSVWLPIFFPPSPLIMQAGLVESILHLFPIDIHCYTYPPSVTFRYRLVQDRLEIATEPPSCLH